MKTKIKRIIKQNKLTNNILEKYINNKIYKKATKYYDNPNIHINEKEILFYSFWAKSYSYSPRQIYETMIKDPYFNDYTFIWVFRKDFDISVYPELKRAKIIFYMSEDYFKYLATAKYIVGNTRLRPELKLKPEQVYIQTWHGTPYKKIGADVSVAGANAKMSRDDLANLFELDAQKITYMPSPSPFYSEKVGAAFNLKKYHKEDVMLELGYPRNDFLVNYTKDDVEKTRKLYNLPDDKKVILYAPTWRDNEYDPGQGYISNYNVDFDYLQKELSDEYVIIFKPHYFISNNFDFSKYKGFLYNGNLVSDINSLYIVADILVTDYSSVFFDYAILNREIIFFMYDYDFYRNELRGFNLEDDELPGPIVKDEENLVKQIKNNNNIDLSNFNKRFNPHEDGNSAQRIVDYIFKENIKVI